MSRGQGATTKQMLDAKTGSFYIWVNRHLDYPVRLSRKIDRWDLQIVPPSFLERPENVMGATIVDVVVDHAAELTERQIEGLGYLGSSRRYDP